MGRTSTICSHENGHGMQGRPLQRSLSDGPLMVLCICHASMISGTIVAYQTLMQSDLASPARPSRWRSHAAPPQPCQE